jgi:gas vesicle protein
MSRKKSMGVGYLILGFLGGALMGGVVAFLTAPASGARTRKQIRRSSREMLDRAEESLDETRERIKLLAADINDRTEDLRSQSMAGLQQIQKQWNAALEETSKMGVKTMKQMRRVAR